MKPKKPKRALRWYTDPHWPGQFDQDYKRFWPKGHIGGRSGLWVVRITCADPYVAQWVRDETHAPLSVWVSDRRGRKHGWVWVEVGSNYPNLEDAKRAGEKYFLDHPELNKPPSNDAPE